MQCPRELALKTDYLESVARHWSLPYVVSGFIVIYFNLLPIFGFNGLWADDQMYYFMQVAGDQYPEPWHEGFRRGFILIFYYPVIQLLSISPKLARFVLVAVLMVPLCWLFFYLYREVFGLPTIVSLASSVLPHILPGQYEVPLFVGGSYTVPILILGFIPLFLGLRYLKSEKPDLSTYLCALLAQFAFLLLKEHSAFIAIPYMAVFLGFTKLGRRHLFLVGPFLLFLTIRVIYTLVYPAGNSIIARPRSLSALAERVQTTAMVVDPIYNFLGTNVSSLSLYYLIFVGVIILGLIFYLKGPDHNLQDEDGRPSCVYGRKYFSAYLFGFVWTLATIIPFFFAFYFPERYAHLCSFGYCLILSMSIYSVLTLGNRLKTGALFAIVIFGMLCTVGQLRYYRTEPSFQYYNIRMERLVKNLYSRSFPQHSQIVVSGTPELKATEGLWAWSSGLLKYITRRSDITGLISAESTFYDPFNGPALYFPPETGLYLNRPTFLYRVSGEDFQQVEYALQWKASSRESDWTIYRFDKTSGLPSTFRTGKGWDDYKTTLGRMNEIGIRQTDILWGNGTFETPRERTATPETKCGPHRPKPDIVAQEYSDATWQNGVYRTSNKGKGVFFVVLSKGASLPCKPNHTLIFSKSGKAKVINVDVLQNPDSRSVFISVDIPLDPVGDGFPNPIGLDTN
jgi:hypothetical protein